MVVTTKISVDLTRPNMGAKVNAVQGDGNTRQWVIAQLIFVAVIAIPCLIVTAAIGWRDDFYD